jgi:hypothetical protein
MAGASRFKKRRDWGSARATLWIVFAFAAGASAAIYGHHLFLAFGHGSKAPSMNVSANAMMNGDFALTNDSEISNAIIVFYDPDCQECKRVQNDLLPRIVDEAGAEMSDVRSCNITTEDGARMLSMLEEKLLFQSRVLAPVVVVNGRAYCGLAEIEGLVALGVHAKAQN